MRIIEWIRWLFISKEEKKIRESLRRYKWSLIGYKGDYNFLINYSRNISEEIYLSITSAYIKSVFGDFSNGINFSGKGTNEDYRNLMIILEETMNSMEIPEDLIGLVDEYGNLKLEYIKYIGG